MEEKKPRRGRPPKKNTWGGARKGAGAKKGTGGGAREGAGRPKKGEAPMSRTIAFRCTEEIGALYDILKAKKLNPNGVLSDAIKRLAECACVTLPKTTE